MSNGEELCETPGARLDKHFSSSEEAQTIHLERSRDTPNWESAHRVVLKFSPAQIDLMDPSDWKETDCYEAIIDDDPYGIRLVQFGCVQEQLEEDLKEFVVLVKQAETRGDISSGSVDLDGSAANRHLVGRLAAAGALRAAGFIPPKRRSRPC